MCTNPGWPRPSRDTHLKRLHSRRSDREYATGDPLTPHAEHDNHGAVPRRGASQGKITAHPSSAALRRFDAREASPCESYPFSRIHRPRRLNPTSRPRGGLRPRRRRPARSVTRCPLLPALEARGGRTPGPVEQRGPHHRPRADRRRLAARIRAMAPAERLEWILRDRMIRSRRIYGAPAAGHLFHGDNTIRARTPL